MEDRKIELGAGKAWVQYMYSAAKDADDFRRINRNAVMDNGRPNVSEFVKFYDSKVAEILEYVRSAQVAEDNAMFDSVRKTLESDRSPRSLAVSRRIIMDRHSGVRRNMGPEAVKLDEMLSDCITTYNYVERLSDYRKI